MSQVAGSRNANGHAHVLTHTCGGWYTSSGTHTRRRRQLYLPNALSLVVVPTPDTRILLNTVK